jgi:gliding motility-associated-like protein
MQLHVAEVSTNSITHYSWSPADFLNDPLIASPVAILQRDQHYFVTGETAEGCQGFADVLIKVYKGPDIYIPTAFSPNHDGLNDILKALPVGIKEFHFFTVFNRSGQSIFTTRDASRGWDGTIRGIEQSTGVYVWIAEGIDVNGNTISRKGLVTIIR